MSHKLVSLYIGDGEYYTRTDADKVIAELEEKHKTEVKELLYLIRDKENNFNRAFDSEEKEIRHQKYKRCLAMVEWCSYKSECFDQYSRHTDYLPNIEKYRRKRNHYADRCNKLLLLAEKFKEAK